MKFLFSRGNRFSTAHASDDWSRRQFGVDAADIIDTTRFACVVSGIGHAGNGDAMLAYHLMDFSRYFFDQSDIRH